MSEQRDIECPEWVCALIRHLGWRVWILENNRNENPDFRDPTYNTGSRWANDTFSLRAFYWGDDEEEANFPNFKCGDFEIEWYKNLGRGTTMNREITPDEAIAMFDRCRESMRESERLALDGVF